MIYNHILVDLSNLFWRLKHKTSNSLDITKKLINYTENEIKSHLHKDGVLWILFDALSYSDLGSEKAFLHSTKRKEILPDYKENRKRSNLFLSTMELYRKYYCYRGDKIRLVYSDCYEADDYCEPIIDSIIKTEKDSKIAILTTDYDAARYLSSRVSMINKSWEKPFTEDDFFNVFKFYPTKQAVIMYKALYGDPSDNIHGAIFIKKAKFICQEGIKMLCFNFLTYINENQIGIDEIVKAFKTGFYYKVKAIENKTPMEELFCQLKSNDLKLPMMNHLFNNISIIKSELEGKNISDLIHWNSENKTTNDIIEKSIFKSCFKNTFGVC